MTEPDKNGQIIILVTEDDTLVRMVFSDILTEDGYRVLEATNAAEALLLLEARRDIHVLLTDVNMPGDINGFMLARLVQHRWPEIGIIIISGGEIAGPGDVPEGAAWLRKPVSPSNLIAAVHDLIATRETQTAKAPSRDDAEIVPALIPDAISGHEGLSELHVAQPVAKPEK
jgi:two-component system, response regulator PdtaR